jgi:hypothetical protein
MKNTVSTIDNMFDPPQLTKYKIENWKNIAGKKIREALPELNDDQLCDDVNEDVYSDYYDYTPEELPDYAPAIIDVLKPYLQHFAERRPIEIDSMWTQTAYKHQFHRVHNHGNMGWSAILYVDFDSKEHDGTVYYHALNDLREDSNIDVFQPKVKEGDLVIFPAYVPHEASMNMSDTPRRIISFNIRDKTPRPFISIP